MSKPATKPKPAATSKPATKPKPAETSKPWQTTHDLGLLGPRNPCLGPPHPGGRGIQPKHMQWPTVRQAFAPVKCTLIRWGKKVQMVPNSLPGLSGGSGWFGQEERKGWCAGFLTINQICTNLNFAPKKSSQKIKVSSAWWDQIGGPYH